MDDYQQSLQELHLKRRRRRSWLQFSIAMGLIPVSFLMWLGGLEMGITGRPEPTKNLIGVICAGAAPLVANPSDRPMIYLRTLTDKDSQLPSRVNVTPLWAGSGRASGQRTGTLKKKNSPSPNRKWADLRHTVRGCS